MVVFVDAFGVVGSELRGGFCERLVEMAAHHVFERGFGPRRVGRGKKRRDLISVGVPRDTGLLDCRLIAGFGGGQELTSKGNMAVEQCGQSGTSGLAVEDCDRVADVGLVAPSCQLLIATAGTIADPCLPRPRDLCVTGASRLDCARSAVSAELAIRSRCSRDGSCAALEFPQPGEPRTASGCEITRQLERIDDDSTCPPRNIHEID